MEGGRNGVKRQEEWAVVFLHAVAAAPPPPPLTPLLETVCLRPRETALAFPLFSPALCHDNNKNSDS